MYPQIDEVELEQRVTLYLAATRPELKRLGVKAYGATVRLSGQLSSFYLRQVALAATKRVAGVQAVSDGIEVRHATGPKFRSLSSRVWPGKAIVMKIWSLGTILLLLPALGYTGAKLPEWQTDKRLEPLAPQPLLETPAPPIHRYFDAPIAPASQRTFWR